MDSVDLVQTIVALVFIIRFEICFKRKIFNINGPLEMKLTILRLGFSNLCEHKAVWKSSHSYEWIVNSPISFSTINENNFITYFLYGDDDFANTKN